MKVKPESLANHLKGKTAPIYLLSGDEPLLLQEAADQVRSALKREGYEERIVLVATREFNWSELAREGNELSLFAERKVVDLRLPTGKPGRDGGKALVEWCENPPEDKVLLIVSSKLDKASQKTKWFKTVESAGVTVQIWPVEAEQMAQWVADRMESMGLRTTPGVAAIVAERAEGNLLAAVQELEKLVLFVEPDTAVDEETANRVVSESSSFNAFKLADAVLEGNRARALRILHGLKGEGVAIQVVHWSVARDFRDLAAMGIERNPSAYKPLEYNPMWWKKQPLLMAALNRIGVPKITPLVRQLGLIDRAGKGMMDGDPWSGMEDFVVRATVA
ncbi:MAG: DNA polymerase III subunit delta [Gammaproteobacteria bacterium]|uniref:DNA polymerase III subunit delta n=1 Tax=Candidatus Thiopontia autotrophica TaxID=2841688 RepID=A0A8J6P769_9GAMM|nr:DNA polymerase III subunit delta [Candidatus Thiopontia autotrophica]MBL6969510.1 DNA polymerase III subunit delta [Gammaproteobacteria bacterium]